MSDFAGLGQTIKAADLHLEHGWEVAGLSASYLRYYYPQPLASLKWLSPSLAIYSLLRQGSA
jgi:hypothetical protein